MNLYNDFTKMNLNCNLELTDCFESDNFPCSISTIDDYTKTIELVNFNKNLSVGKSPRLLNHECDEGIIHLNNESCCFYKYSHNLPHNHISVSKSIQCDSNSEEDYIPMNYIPTDVNNHSCFDGFSNHKMLDFINKDLPKLQESKRFISKQKQSKQKSLENIFNIGTTNDLSEEYCETDFCQNFIQPNSLNSCELNQNFEIVEISENCATVNDLSSPVSPIFGGNSDFKDFNDTTYLPTKEIVGNNSKTEQDMIGKSLDLNRNTKTELSRKSKMELGNSTKSSNISKQYYLAEPINERNTVRGKYCSTKLVKQRFFLTENSNIENILKDPSDRRIKATCDRFNCDVSVYSKVVKNGYLKNIIVISAPNYDNMRKCVRSLDNNMGWCLYSQIN